MARRNFLPISPIYEIRDIRPTIYFEDLTRQQIEELMAVHVPYKTVSEIIHGRISPESRENAQLLTMTNESKPRQRKRIT